LGPDHFHGLDTFARQLVAARESGAVVGHLILVPAVADTEQETAARDLVDRSHLLGGLDRVALRDQANAGPKQQRFGHRRGRTQHHERDPSRHNTSSADRRRWGKATCASTECGNVRAE
jgi:hypothetical protein